MDDSVVMADSIELDDDIPPFPRYVEAPFRLEPGERFDETLENLAFFNDTFPLNRGYIIDELFLNVYTNTRRDPPKTFGGMPVAFVPHEGGRTPLTEPPFAWLEGLVVTINPHPIPDDRGWAPAEHSAQQEWTPMFEVIRKHFEYIDVCITEVIYWHHFVQIVLLDRSASLEMLPSSACGVFCRYLFEDEMMRPPVPQSSISRLRSLDPPERLARSSRCCWPPAVIKIYAATLDDGLDSLPGENCVEGLVLGSAYRLVPGVAAFESEWQPVHWVFLGDDTYAMHDCIPGTAVRDENGRVVSRVQYTFTEGSWASWCIASLCEDKTITSNGFNGEANGLDSEAADAGRAHTNGGGVP